MTDMDGLDGVWRKSSYSNASGGECVEMAVTWRKSSYSNDTGGNCVEVADTAYGAAVRDTQNRDRGHLAFPASEWSSFLKDLKERRL
ncbi:DUF397 domain-containing protein [Streptomonospora salina]|uniref:DUF397 domain-containing protein n=1 Tax=Streptomonospora salina TaxID=104205 RepID=A0A841EC73_9ACTN|nr:DUF397 domain-containing protein [Streptomonospora salina]MBB5997041.1 hypothetical protein [Streptomonospora salina]